MRVPLGEDIVKLIKDAQADQSYTAFTKDTASSRSGIYRLATRQQEATIRQLVHLSQDCNCEFHVIIAPGPVPITATIHPVQERQP